MRRRRRDEDREQRKKRDRQGETVSMRELDK